jgi:hypothetical protein
MKPGNFDHETERGWGYGNRDRKQSFGFQAKSVVDKSDPSNLVNSRAATGAWK